MRDATDPPRRHFELKPKEFDRINVPNAAESSSPGGGLPSDGAPVSKVEIADFYRDAAVPGPVLRHHRERLETDVNDVLRRNMERETAAGLNELAAKPRRRSRRRRDYAILMAATNVPLALLAAAGIKAHNPFVFIFAFAGMVFLSVALTWIWWAIVDDY